MSTLQRHNEMWSTTKKLLRAELGDAIYYAWIKSLNLEGITGMTLHLSVVTTSSKNWIDSHYSDKILALFSREGVVVNELDIQVRGVFVSRQLNKKAEPEVITEDVPEQPEAISLEEALKRAGCGIVTQPKSKTVTAIDEGTITLEDLPNKRRRIESIQQYVCAQYKITVDEMISHGKSKRIVFPRNIAMYLAYKLVMNSYEYVGKCFGGRNHSTIISNIRKLEENMHRSSKIRAEVQGLIDLFLKT